MSKFAKCLSKGVPLATQFILYSYFRSSASYRVRIALNLKGLNYEYRAIHLLKNGGEQYSAEYKSLNPQSQVPCLIHNQRAISQSVAIVEYLDQIAPEPRLIPSSPYERALTLQLCEIVNSGIQPLQNTGVLKELENIYHFSPEQKNQWVRTWNERGLASFEEIIKKTAGDFCLGNQVTAADCFLIPQLFAARRFSVDLSRYPTILRVEESTKHLEAFLRAEPSRQPDHEP
jgi:maleylacetoacetate isomerase